MNKILFWHRKDSVVNILSFVIWGLLIGFVNPGFSEPLRMAAGLSVEPYINEETNSGVELDIVRGALAVKGYEVSFVYQPLKRTKVSYKNGTVDGVLTIKPNYPEVKGAFLSDHYISYQNVAITLKSKRIQIKNVFDLQNKRVVAFQQATEALGKDFVSMAGKNPYYREHHNQASQVKLLFSSRTEVIILDYNIFQYYKKRLKDISKNSTVEIHHIFRKSDFSVAFREQKIRDIFNQGLQIFKKSAEYHELIAPISLFARVD